MQAANGDDRTLRRIGAILVALAVLAERAATRSWPVRCFVLFLLRRAEVAARDFAFEAAGVPVAIEPFPAFANRPDDALGLAARFRALAALLAALLPEADWLDGWPAPRRGLAFGQVAPCLGRVPNDRAPKPCDTS